MRYSTFNKNEKTTQKRKHTTEQIGKKCKETKEEKQWNQRCKETEKLE